MRAVVVLFTRDLRVADHPALAAACRRGGPVVPLFVLDAAILGTPFACPNRVRFLLQSLEDLRAELEARGGTLVVRRGDVVAETMRIAEEADADAVHVSEDYTPYARRRERRLASVCRRSERAFRSFPGVTAVRPGELRTVAGGHFELFTPYWNRWRTHRHRRSEAAPRRVPASRLARGRIPALATLLHGRPSAELPRGGEREGRRRLAHFLRRGLGRYATGRDDLAADATSRLGAYLHFGCLSPAEIVARARRLPRSEDFVRQLCWRDFHHQVLEADPTYPSSDHRLRGDRWRDEPEALAAWKAGRTGIPIVDAGMRQLAREGFMPNRARLIVASFLTKHCGIDWRLGARHFYDLLVDGDVASNAGNWQWVAGTGNDPRPNRLFNPIRQAHRYDPSGAYVRHWVPELAAIDGRAVHEPWKLDPESRAALDYPEPIVDLDEAAARFRARRAR